MAVGNSMFTIFRNKQLGSGGTLSSAGGIGVDFNTDTLKIVVVDEGGYTPNLTTHDYFNDITASTFDPTTQAACPTLATITIGTLNPGVFDADDTTFTSLAAGPAAPYEGLILFKATGTDSTSDLVAIWDTGITGLPVTPSGGNVTVVWNASGIIQF